MRTSHTHIHTLTRNSVEKRSIDFYLRSLDSKPKLTFLSSEGTLPVELLSFNVALFFILEVFIGNHRTGTASVKTTAYVFIKILYVQFQFSLYKSGSPSSESLS